MGGPVFTVLQRIPARPESQPDKDVWLLAVAIEILSSIGGIVWDPLISIGKIREQRRETKPHRSPIGRLARKRTSCFLETRLCQLFRYCFLAIWIRMRKKPQTSFNRGLNWLGVFVLTSPDRLQGPHPLEEVGGDLIQTNRFLSQAFGSGLEV